MRRLFVGLIAMLPLAFLAAGGWFQGSFDNARAVAKAQNEMLLLKFYAELSKEDPGILDTLAAVFYSMGRTGEAIQTIDKAIAQKPDDPYYKDQRAKFLSKDGEKTGK